MAKRSAQHSLQLCAKRARNKQASEGRRTVAKLNGLRLAARLLRTQAKQQPPPREFTRCWRAI